MSAVFNEIIILNQDNGQDISLRVNGDEFYARLETLEGYSVVNDSRAGCYCYAELRDGCFVSSDIPATKTPPPMLRRHLHENQNTVAEKFNRRFTVMRGGMRGEIGQPASAAGSPDINFVTGPNNGLLEGRQISEGEVLGLTVLVNFSDVTTTITNADVNDLLNGDNYTRNGNFSSARQYFIRVSSNKLDYANHVVGPITLGHNKKYYETHSIVPEAMKLAVQQLKDEQFDFSRFDSTGEGIFDALSFMYAGTTVYGINGNNNNPSNLWPHNSTVDLYYEGLSTHFYMLTSLGRSPVDLSIGTFVHESSHMLCRFPDLYDYGRRDGDLIKSMGIGPYCLMGSGNHLNRGRTPAPPCAYLRELVGWSDDIVLLRDGESYNATHGHYNTIYKYETDNSDEYFLIENRHSQALDRFQTSSGLAVYHCDRRGSNELQQGTATQHYQCALLQADGRRDLESNREADTSDLFAQIEGLALGKDTNPSTRLWDGSESGLKISDTGEPGNIIAFRVGEKTKDIVGGSVRVNGLIPDFDETGIISSIAIAQNGEVSAIEVSIDVTHTYTGDLKVTLIAPNGNKALIHDQTGAGQHDIIQTWQATANQPLQALQGNQSAGEWRLQVQDLLKRDTGRLNDWSLALQLKPADTMLEQSVSPNQPIPDNDRNGIVSTMTIAQSGKLSDIEVQISIPHTYIGDLSVELVSPTGLTALLHDMTGGRKHDLKASYTAQTTARLALFSGSEIQGDWQLRVHDLQRSDQGKLEQWSLKLRYVD